MNCCNNNKKHHEQEKSNHSNEGAQGCCGGRDVKHDSVNEHNNNSGIKQDYYTCPMHPEIKQDSPGKCPKCGGMDLVRKSSLF